MAPEPWYSREPERLQWELDQFPRHGLLASSSFDDQARLVVATEVRFQGEPLAVTATFSHGHPYFAPTIAADHHVLERHQDPIGKNFCLLEDPRADWRPWFSGAQLIGKALRRLLRDTEKGKEAVQAGEADMPEPVSAQFRYDSGTVVLVGEPFLARELRATSGTITLLGPGRIRVLGDATGIGELGTVLAKRYAEPSTAGRQGRWVAIDAPPSPDVYHGGILTVLEDAEGKPLQRLAGKLRGRKGRREESLLIGITFLEEGPSRSEERRTWLFAELGQKRGDQPRVRKLWRAQALVPAERARRIPELAGLETAHVVVVGAGSLGGPVAFELAKAGVGQLDLFDDDHYDLNNSVRHVLPTTQAGVAKAAAVAEACRALNPFIEVCGHELSIGDSVDATERLDGALRTAKVVIDTTGAQDVARYLAEKTRGAGATLIVAGLTSGGFGGDLVVVAPGAACFQCFIRAQQEGRIPKPPQSERSNVTPIGCRHPAFAGAGFEATELAAIISRRAVQAIGLTSYPKAQSNWIVLDFRAAPHFQEGQLAPVGDCETHP